MDGAEVRVLEKAREVGLGGLLEGQEGVALEALVQFPYPPTTEVVGNLPHQPLERELAEKQVSALLVPTDLTESNGARPAPVGLLDTTSGRGTLPRGFRGESFAGTLATSGLASGLLGTGH